MNDLRSLLEALESRMTAVYVLELLLLSIIIIALIIWIISMVIKAIGSWLQMTVQAGSLIKLNLKEHPLRRENLYLTCSGAVGILFGAVLLFCINPILPFIIAPFIIVALFGKRTQRDGRFHDEVKDIGDRNLGKHRRKSASAVGPMPKRKRKT